MLVPLCMVQAGTCYLPNRRLERKGSQESWPRLCCGAGKGGSSGRLASVPYARRAVRRAEPRDAVPTTQGRVTAPSQLAPSPPPPRRSMHHSGSGSFL